MTTPATMQSGAMRRSGVMTTTATMQWGHPQPRSGEGDEAMRRSGVMTTPATIYTAAMRWGHPRLRGRAA